ncbi:hypothetical protein AAE478_003141 [Parahypoxylon ruwenzoriense]
MAPKDSTAPRQDKPAQTSRSVSLPLRFSIDDISEEVIRSDRETLRLYGFHTEETGTDLNKLAAVADAGYPSLHNNLVLAFEPFYFFFYGSLQDPNVLRRVCNLPDVDETPELRPASIKGWRSMMWGMYPALVPQEGSVVNGKYWRCENAKMVEYLRQYETKAYTMAHCQIITVDGEVLDNGRVFVFRDGKSDLTEGSFDLKEFMEKGRPGEGA